MFRQPFSVFTVPCFLVVGPLWLISHNYRMVVWGWTPWHALVVAATLYALYNVVAANLLPVLPGLPQPFG